MDTESSARRLRRERIFSDPSRSSRALVPALERMLPHRPPMRLIDEVSCFDPERGRIRGARRVERGDLGLDGHFPGAPVYPGVLQVEAIGQLGLCLAWLMAAHGDDAAPQGPIDARLLKIHHACFVAPVLPTSALTVEARLLDENSLSGVVAGQVWRDETLCSYAILEVYYV